MRREAAHRGEDAGDKDDEDCPFPSDALHACSFGSGVAARPTPKTPVPRAARAAEAAVVVTVVFGEFIWSI
jgi:hypothetical protein